MTKQEAIRESKRRWPGRSVIVESGGKVGIGTRRRHTQLWPTWEEAFGEADQIEASFADATRCESEAKETQA